ncbi:MAG: glucosyltransferase domain-containing protein [Clostridia bacterium]|nr:glucosyltransferase domain-containing protein [Clostridia bacterium]
MKKIFKQINKENKITFILTLIITILICQNFLQMHYSSDTYVLYDLGYMQYPQKYFLLDGRFISAIVCYLAGLIKIPINAYIIGMDFIGIIFIATAIYIINDIVLSLIKIQDKKVKIATLASSFVLILNQFALEYLLFPESAIMCLGVLLNVIAVKFMVKETKHKYVKIFITLLIAALCYQGELNIFPILALTIYIIKQITDKREYKIKEKEFLIEMIKLAGIVCVVLVILLVLVKFGKNLLNSKQDRMMHLNSLEAVKLRGRTVLEYMEELWTQNMHMLPKHASTIVLLTSLILLITLRTKKEFIMQYILTIFVAFFICVLPMFLFNTGICGRVNVPLMMLWGASLLILIAQSTIIESQTKKRIIYAFAIISFIINSIFLMQNITEHIASNRIEENNGKTIKYLIEKYESETGHKVTKFSYLYDRDPQQFAVGIKPIGSLTERKLACSWSVLQAMNFYCERKFQLVGIQREEYDEYFLNKDYSEFSEEQIVIKNDTIYMLIY